MSRWWWHLLELERSLDHSKSDAQTVALNQRPRDCGSGVAHIRARNLIATNGIFVFLSSFSTRRSPFCVKTKGLSPEIIIIQILITYILMFASARARVLRQQVYVKTNIIYINFDFNGFSRLYAQNVCH